MHFQASISYVLPVKVFHHSSNQHHAHITVQAHALRCTRYVCIPRCCRVRFNCAKPSSRLVGHGQGIRGGQFFTQSASWSVQEESEQTRSVTVAAGRDCGQGGFASNPDRPLADLITKVEGRD